MMISNRIVTRSKRYSEGAWLKQNSSFSLLFQGNYLQEKTTSIEIPPLVSILIKYFLFLLKQGETDEQRGMCY